VVVEGHYAANSGTDPLKHNHNSIHKTVVILIIMMEKEFAHELPNAEYNGEETVVKGYDAVHDREPRIEQIFPL
jgi:hypothetical protein